MNSYNVPTGYLYKTPSEFDEWVAVATSQKMGQRISRNRFFQFDPCMIVQRRSISDPLPFVMKLDPADARFSLLRLIVKLEEGDQYQILQSFLAEERKMLSYQAILDDVEHDASIEDELNAEAFDEAA